MRNLLPILVLFVGILVVAAAFWLLISPEEDRVYPLDPVPENPVDHDPDPAGIQGDIENTERPLEGPGKERLEVPREIEKILPSRVEGSARGGLSSRGRMGGKSPIMIHVIWVGITTSMKSPGKF